MKIKIIYHSRTGNTKKVAEAISEAINVIAEPIPEKGLDEPVDLLFIGNGIYMGKADMTIENFIKTLNRDMVKNAAVFGTFGGQNKAIEMMKELLEKQGIHVMDESFGCRGKAWLVLNRQHPDLQDLNNAKEFAKFVIGKIK